jgi:uncharacterized membrane protein HdeD (DUF308 family)
MRRSLGFFLHLIPGVVSIPIGLLVATQPADPTAWTLMLASFLIIVGLFRIIAAIRIKFGQWMWAVADGTVSLAFGVLVWARSPWLAFRYLGIAVGVSLILRGWSSLVFAVGARGSNGSSLAISILERDDSLQSERSGAARNKRKASA